MRTPNCQCVICSKPLYRRPGELIRIRYAACMEHRTEAQRREELTEKQRIALALGRQKGTNHLNGIPKSRESNRKRSESHKRWCAENPDKVKARGEKTRGVNHYNWRGGCSHLNAAVRRLTEHRKWMDAVVRRDGKCLRCGTGLDLEAHHRIPLADLLAKHGIMRCEQAREFTALWDLDNGETLCERCHYKHHGRKYTSSGNGRRKQPRKVRRSMVGENNPNYKGGKVPCQTI